MQTMCSIYTQRTVISSCHLLIEEVYCFLLLFINLRKWDLLHLQNDKFFLQKSVQTLRLSVEVQQVRQIGLLKYFGNTSPAIYNKDSSVTHW